MSEGRPSQSRRSAQERRAAAAQLRQQRASAERRRRTMIAGSGIAAILILIGVLVGVGLSQTTKNTNGSSTTFNGSITAPQASVVDAVGAGTVALRPQAIEAPALTENGKPKIVFVGAEWCPYCAAQRWVIADTLARFGTWSNLSETESSSTDVFPSTHTLSFHGATYKSDYIVFSGAEIQDNQQQPLDKLSAADQKIYTTYDTKAYTGSDGGFPFMDIGGTFLLPGAMFDPGVLQGLTQDQILAALKDPTSPVTKAIIGSSNVLTATICGLTDNKPANVCSAAGVRAVS